MLEELETRGYPATGVWYHHNLQKDLRCMWELACSTRDVANPRDVFIPRRIYLRWLNTDNQRQPGANIQILILDFSTDHNSLIISIFLIHPTGMLQRKDKYVQFHALQQRRINVDKYHVILLYHKTLNIQYNNHTDNISHNIWSLLLSYEL